MDHYFDTDLYDDLINAYINTRYYDMYASVDKRFKVNIAYYLKKALEPYKDDSKYKDKAKYMFHVFKYILYFDNVVECDSVRPLIHALSSFRESIGLDSSSFEGMFYDILKKDLLAKKEFIDSFSDRNFSINFLKIRNNVFNCELVHNLKFSKLYSDYAINKVFGDKEISEQKLFVTYSLVGVKILQDIIKGNFMKKYLVPYCLGLKDKPKKKKRLLNIVDNEITKEKLFLKLPFAEYIQNKDEVYSLTRDGFKFAVVLDDEFELNDENRVLLKVFSYVITDKFYDELKDNYDCLYIPE